MSMLLLTTLVIVLVHLGVRTLKMAPLLLLIRGSFVPVRITMGPLAMASTCVVSFWSLVGFRS